MNVFCLAAYFVVYNCKNLPRSGGLEHFNFAPKSPPRREITEKTHLLTSPTPSCLHICETAARVTAAHPHPKFLDADASTAQGLAAPRTAQAIRRSSTCPDLPSVSLSPPGLHLISTLQRLPDRATGRPAATARARAPAAQAVPAAPLCYSASGSPASANAHSYPDRQPGRGRPSRPRGARCPYCLLPAAVLDFVSKIKYCRFSDFHILNSCRMHILIHVLFV